MAIAVLTSIAIRHLRIFSAGPITLSRRTWIIHARRANVYFISRFRYNPWHPNGARQVTKRRLSGRLEDATTAMGPKWNRRDVLKGLAAASTAIVLPRDLQGSQQDEPIAAPQVEVQITPLSPHTFRLSIL